MKAKFRNIARAFEAPLPGREAQKIMAPSYREEEMLKAAKSIQKAKLSAVMILLLEKHDGLYIPLIERAEYQGVHSGQISFPGGQFDSSDHSFLYTALRETQEETGLDMRQPQVLGKLTDLYIPPSNFLVKPFLAYVEGNPRFKADEKEVKRIVEVPLRDFFAKNAVREKTFESSSTGQKKKAPYFAVKDLEIWGATAMILSELLQIIQQQQSRE